jgi:hypothetical protein
MKQEWLSMWVFIFFFPDGLFASKQFLKIIGSRVVIYMSVQTLLFVRPAFNNG